MGRVEDDAAAARLGVELHGHVRGAEALDDSLGPGQVHPAGQVAVLLDQGVVRDNSGDTRRPPARPPARSPHHAAGPAIARRTRAPPAPRSRAVRRRRHPAPCHAPVRSGPRRRGRSQRRVDRARSPSARPPARSGAGEGRTRSRRRRAGTAWPVARPPVRSARSRRRYSVPEQAGIDEAIEVECRELTADPESSGGLVASDRLAPGDDDVVQAAPRRLGEHGRDLDRVEVGESVGHGPSVTVRPIMKRLATLSGA